MYYLVMLEQSGNHRLRIEAAKGYRFFVFTFGRSVHCAPGSSERVEVAALANVVSLMDMMCEPMPA